MNFNRPLSPNIKYNKTHCFITRGSFYNQNHGFENYIVWPIGLGLTEISHWSGGFSNGFCYGQEVIDRLKPFDQIENQPIHLVIDSTESLNLK